MIDEIYVENLALIKKASLIPSSGLTVLTGETGAGKTALLSAIKLLLGARADRDAVREGCDKLTCEGRFLNVPRAITGEEFARDTPLPEPGFDDEAIVSRTVTSEGRSRAYLDGNMTSLDKLTARIAPTVDLCGQHEQQRLMRSQNHVELLDSWADGQTDGQLSVVRDAYRAAYNAAYQAAKELERVRKAGESSSAALDEARFVLKRIDEVNPLEGEYEELEASLSKAEHAETLATAADTAYRCLSGEDGALDALYSAAQALEGASRYDAHLGNLAASLQEASYVLEDVSRDARDYRDSVEFDAQELAFQQERMSALLGLLRAYGPRMEDVFAAREKAADAVSLVDDAAQREAAAKKALDQAEKELAEAAQSLADMRMQMAPLFAEKVTEQMARLEMGDSQLVCKVVDLPRKEWSFAGSQAVEFCFRPGKSMQARPLAKIASGGELSRVLLAVKVVLGAQDSAETLVFDEVDAGVGGATAVALADVLADLAKTHQVLVVTHLAQVAVRAQTHYVVRKQEGDIPETQLLQVDDDDRVDEIARMLSGGPTDASRAHAREMLAAGLR